ASTPACASSKTKQSDTGTPNARAALRKTSGCGLDRETELPSITESKHSAVRVCAKINCAFLLAEPSAVRIPLARAALSKRNVAARNSQGVTPAPSSRYQPFFWAASRCFSVDDRSTLPQSSRYSSDCCRLIPFSFSFCCHVKSNPSELDRRFHA